VLSWIKLLNATILLSTMTHVLVVSKTNEQFKQSKC